MQDHSRWVGFAVALLLTSAVAGATSLELTAISPVLEVRPGELVVHVFSLRNTGVVDLTVAVEVEVPPGWELLGVPAAVVVPAGQDEPLFVVALSELVTQAGDYEVRVRVTWNGQVAQARGVVRIQKVLGVELTVGPPGEVEPGQDVTFTVTVFNAGNAVDRIGLTCRGPGQWACSVEPKAVTLAPQESRDVEARIKVPANAAPGRKVVWVEAKSDAGALGRAVWFFEVVPPTPGAVKGSVFADLAMRLGGTLKYELLSGQPSSSLTLRGVGLVLAGRVALDCSWAGPWSPQPFALTSISFVYEGEVVRAAIGDASLTLSPNLLAVSGTGFAAELRLPRSQLAMLSGWSSTEARFGARAKGTVELGSVLLEAGLAYRDTRAAARAVALTGWTHVTFFQAFRVEGEAGVGATGSVWTFSGRAGFVLLDLPALAQGSSLRAEVFGAGRDFPGPNANRAGFSLSGSLLAEPLGVRFSTRWERDNLPPLSSVPTLARSNLTVGVDWAPKDAVFTAHSRLTIDRSVRLTGIPPLDVRVRTLHMGVGLGKSPLVVGLRGTWKLKEDVVASSSEWTHSYEESLSWTVGDYRFGLMLAQEITFTVPPVVENRARFEVRFPGALSLQWDQDEDGGSVRFEIGPQDLTDQLEVSGTLAVRWDPGGKPKSVVLGAGFSFGFNVTPPFLPVRGWLEGRLFVDSNGNGKSDPGEPGVGGAVVKAGKERAATDAAGAFLLPPLDPGTYELGLERAPRGVKPAVKLPLRVEVVLAGRTKVEVPFVRVAEVTGRVFHDLDRDGKPGPAEPGLRRVRVVLLRGDSVVDEALTDPLGQFAFLDLPSGTYTVRVDSTGLPEGYEPTMPESRDLEVAPGDVVRVEFGFWQRPRPVVVFQLPLAEFTWTPERPKSGEPVTFDGTLSSDPDGRIVAWSWDFTGDGKPDAQGPGATWTFRDPGLYLVTLTVTDNDGFQDRLSQLVEVVP